MQKNYYFVIFFFISLISFSQKQIFFQKDSIKDIPIKKSYFLLPKTIVPNNKLEKIFGEKKSLTFSSKDSELKNYNMPIFVPNGNFKMRLIEIDSLKKYSVRIVKPK